MTKEKSIYSKVEEKTSLNSNYTLRHTNLTLYLQDNWTFHLEICAGYVLLELPFPVVQWTYLASFEPARDAVEVESVLEDKVQIT